MATTRDNEYTINGVVIDRATQRGVRGVRVDAWDRDTRYHDLLGQATTDEDGVFTIGYGSVYFGDFAPDRSPDVFFKVFLDGREVLSTFDRTQMNVPTGAMRVTLELDMPQLTPQGTDRVSTEQTLKVVEWWSASDFRGVMREGKDKASTLSKLLGAAAGRSFETFDLKPLRPAAVREKAVVNQSVGNAQSALAQQQVEVAEVRTVGSAGSAADLKTLPGYPLTLAPGDRVTLYEENGVVKYYTRVKPVQAEQVDSQTVARIDGDLQSLKAQVRSVDVLHTEVANLKSSDSMAEQRFNDESASLKTQSEEVARLRRELNDVRQAAANKDAEIARLSADLTIVRSTTDTLIARIPIERLNALELQMSKFIETTPTPKPTVPRSPPKGRGKG